MSKYTFTFKKDDIFVEFTTTDKDTVERQFKIWVADADAHARKAKQKALDSTMQTINTIKQAYEQPAVKPQPEIKSEPKPQQPVIEPAVEPIIEAVPESKPDVVVEEPIIPEENNQEQVFDKASSLLKTINTIQNEDILTEADIEQVSNDSANDFESVLEQKIEQPTFEPNVTKDPIFLNLVNSKNTTDKFHHLIITAYYLSEFEKLDRFSLKLINAKLMQNLSVVIDHVTLQEAINQDLIEAVPDLTGVADVSEYRLTSLGEEFFAHKIG